MIMRLGRPADGLSVQIQYRRYCRKIFILYFKVIFIFKILNFNDIMKGLAGEQSTLASVAKIISFLPDHAKW
jgi:hypothetical protein